MLAAAETVHEFVEGPQRSFRLPTLPQSNLSLMTSVVVQDAGDAADIEVDEDATPEPIELAKAQLEEVVRLGRIDVGRFPMSPTVRINLARSLFNLGDLDGAEREASTAMDIDGKNLAALSLLGYVHIAQRHLGAARGVFTNALRQAPNDVEALRGLAEVAVREARYDEARSTWTRLDELLADSPVPPYQLGLLALRGLQNISQSIAFLKKAARRNPRWAPSYHALGAAYSLAGQADKSARAFQAALRLDPEMSDAVHGLATALLQANHREAALAVLEQGVAAHPRDYRLRELLADVHVHEQRYRQARTQLFAALHEVQQSGHPSEHAGRLANNLGVCYVRTKDWIEADQAFVRAMDVAPKKLTIPGNNLALLRMNRGDFEGARGVLAALKEADQADEDAYLIGAESYTRQGLWRQAADEYRECILAGLAGWKTYASLGATLTDAGRDPAAGASLLREGNKLFPNSDLIRNNLAYAELMAGNVASARAILDDPLTVAMEPPGRVLLTATRGLLALWEGRLHEGIDLYDEASQLSSALGHMRFSREIRQKKHLETARAHLRAGNANLAAGEVERGLALVGRRTYRSDLEDLAPLVGVKVPSGPSRELRRHSQTREGLGN